MPESGPGNASPVTSTPPAPERRDRTSGAAARSAWAWPVAFVVVVLAMVGAGLYVFESVRRLPGSAVESGRAVLGELRSVAEAFRQGTIETRFVSYATRTTGTTYLQFATLEQMEIFRRRDTSSLLWGQLDLPDVVVEARAPVTYTYFVDLADDWGFRIEGRHIGVTAPPIRFNRPAIDASAIRLEPLTSSLFRDEDAALEALRGSLSTMVARRARQHIPTVRETGRRQIGEFVTTWLAGSFVDGGEYSVDVIFDEGPRMVHDPDGRP